MATNPFAATLTPTPHPKRTDRFRFSVDQSIVSSAFVLPLLRKSGSSWVLCQEEDEPDDDDRDAPRGQRRCTPKLAMLGGKVSENDTHWTVTATREVAEETGTKPDGTTLLSTAALNDIQQGFSERAAAKPSAEARNFAAYIATDNACAQLVCYPVPEDFRAEWASLPERYALEFRGAVDHERERHGTKLVWIRVRASSAAGEPCLDLTGVTHECEDPEKCAARCGRTGLCPQRGQPALLKRILWLALPALIERRGALQQYLIANRLHRLVKSRAGGPPEGRATVGQLTHAIMKAWSKEGRLHELEKAIEKEGWLRKEADKVAGKLNGGSTGGERPGERPGEKRKREEASNGKGDGKGDGKGASTSASGGEDAVCYGARHLLIKFSGSRKPFSRRTNASTEDVTADAARTELEALSEQIRSEGC